MVTPMVVVGVATGVRVGAAVVVVVVVGGGMGESVFVVRGVKE